MSRDRKGAVGAANEKGTTRSRSWLSIDWRGKQKKHRYSVTNRVAALSKSNLPRPRSAANFKYGSVRQSRFQ